MKNILKSKIKKIEKTNSNKILNLINSLSDQIKTENYSKETKKLYDVLNNKFPEITKDNLNKDQLSEKSYTIISEINKINLKNTDRLLDAQNGLMERYSRNIIEESILLNERLKKNFSMNYLYLMIFSFCAYEYYSNFYNHNKFNLDINKIISDYQKNCGKLLEFETKIPFFEDHSNLTNLLKNYSRLFLIGETGIGKSLSIKNYVLIESQNSGSIVLYFDLNKVNFDISSNNENFLLSPLLKAVKKDNISSKVIDELVTKLKEYNVIIILDNFTSFSEKLLLKSMEFANKINGKLISIAKDNEFSENALNSIIYLN